ncbi:hypothetical protein [Brucella vulpis]|uniref:hypothetical protein n=1 Tax=Brucella vulpis TaxID=981386 RepID=UPI0009E2FB03
MAQPLPKPGVEAAPFPPNLPRYSIGPKIDIGFHKARCFEKLKHVSQKAGNARETSNQGFTIAMREFGFHP